MEERLVISMNGKELRRFRVILEVKSGYLSQIEAAEELRISTRQLRILLAQLILDFFFVLKF